MVRISLGLLCCGLWTGLAAGQQWTPEEPSYSAAIAATADQPPGYTRIAKPYAPQPPRSVFIERTTDPYGFPMVSSRRFVAPNIPLADPYSAVTAPYAAAAESAATNPFVKPLDITGIDPFGVMPYFSYLDYGTKSVKSIGEVTGIYAYASTTINMVELGIDDTRINFRNGFSFYQQDITAILSDYAIPNVRLRAGVHYMNNNDPTTSGVIIGFGGAHYFVKDHWEAGVDVYASWYANYLPPVTITQVTPRVSCQLNSVLRVEATGYYIHPDKEIGLNKQNFYSLEGRLTRDFGRYEVGAFGWGGEQTFAVRNDGFVVFNLNEKHTGGFGGEVVRKFGKHTRLTTRVRNEQFSDFASQQATNQIAITMMLLHTF